MNGMSVGEVTCFTYLSRMFIPFTIDAVSIMISKSQTDMMALKTRVIAGKSI